MNHPKAARISPDSKLIAYGAAGLATAIYLGAFATSFFGQASLAQFMLIPHPLQFVAPAVVDLALLLFTMATLVRRSRGESTLITNLATGFWTAVSITANIAHVLIPAGPYSSWSAGTFAGAALSALMPLSALGASLVIENVLIARPGAVKAELEAAKPVVTAGAPVTHPVDRVEPKPQAAAVPNAKAEPLPASPKLLPEPPRVQSHSLTLTRPPASAGAGVRKPATGTAPEWKSMTTAERISRIQELQDEGLSLPKVSGELGVSLSTVKRFKADQEERQLQSA